MSELRPMKSELRMANAFTVAKSAERFGSAPAASNIDLFGNRQRGTAAGVAGQEGL
jgi:hypothetical protein